LGKNYFFHLPMKMNPDNRGYTKKPDLSISTTKAIYNWQINHPAKIVAGQTKPQRNPNNIGALEMP